MKAVTAPPRTIDEYIAGFPPTVQTVLKRVRRTIRKAIPGADEAISYRIPTFKVDGRAAIYFAGGSSTTRCTPPTPGSSPRSRTRLNRTRSTTRARSGSRCPNRFPRR